MKNVHHRCYFKRYGTSHGNERYNELYLYLSRLSCLLLLLHFLVVVSLISSSTFYYILHTQSSLLDPFLSHSWPGHMIEFLWLRGLDCWVFKTLSKRKRVKCRLFTKYCTLSFQEWYPMSVSNEWRDLKDMIEWHGYRNCRSQILGLKMKRVQYSVGFQIVKTWKCKRKWK